jgi:hypothetical protein
MNSSYDEVLQTSTSTWRFQRLELVLEFSRKSIVPLNIPLHCVRWIAALFSMCPLLDSAHVFFRDSRINSDLEVLLRAFPPEPFEHGLDYDEMYSDDGQMAALYRDVHGERHWISSLDLPRVESAELTQKRADYIRDCAELGMAMCAKLVGGLEEDAPSASSSDAHDAELRALGGAGRRLSTADLEIRGLKRQVGAMTDEISSARSREERLRLELERVRAERAEQELATQAQGRRYEESIAALEGELAAARKRAASQEELRAQIVADRPLNPLPKMRFTKAAREPGGQG